MNKKIDVILEIIKPGIGLDTKEYLKYKNEDIDWDDIYNFVVLNDIATMTYDPVYAILKDREEYQDLLTRWQAKAKGLGCYQVQHLFNVKEVYNKLEMAGMEPVLFKGNIIGDLYQEDFYRPSKDTDILVEKNKVKAATAIIESMEYKYDAIKSKAEVLVFYNRMLSHKIELHSCLWEDYKGKRMDILRQLGLDSRSNYGWEDIKMGKFRTLEPTNHLIFQIFHIAKHFTVSGIGIKYLTDITAFVNRYCEEIDATRFWEGMLKLDYVKFSRFLFNLCSKYLGMTKKLNIFKAEALSFEEEDIQMFIDDVIHVGDIKNSGIRDYQMLSVMEPYMKGEEKKEAGILEKTIKRAFPGKKQLSDHYSYAKTNGALLPIAWLHKAFVFLVKKLFKKDLSASEKTLSNEEKEKKFQYRIKLLKITGLLDEK